MTLQAVGNVHKERPLHPETADSLEMLAEITGFAACGSAGAALACGAMTAFGVVSGPFVLVISAPLIVGGASAGRAGGKRIADDLEGLCNRRARVLGSHRRVQLEGDYREMQFKEFMERIVPGRAGWGPIRKCFRSETHYPQADKIKLRLPLFIHVFCENSYLLGS